VTATREAEPIVVMGRVTAPYGVRGWLRVDPVSREPDALLAHPTWWVRRAGNSEWRALARTGGRMHSGSIVAALEGVATREQAAALAGAEVGVPRAALPPLKRNEVYLADLPGLEVVNREGEVLGTVVAVTEHGAHPILRVARPAASPGPERLIPCVPAIVERIDVAAGRIDVDWGADF
jgi:16S rRNA processing protein RimM